MNLFAIITLVMMYLCFGIFTWQFWLLAVMGVKQDINTIEKLAKIPLIFFLLFWPISIFALLLIFIMKYYNISWAN